MRRCIHLLGVALLSLFSVELIIAATDWWQRWEWFSKLLSDHRRFASFVHSPIFSFLLLGFGLAYLYAERRLKEANIVARFVNSRPTPDLHSVTMKAMFEAEAKEPGWDENKLDWDWFIEVHVVNDSDTPATIEEAKVRMRIKRKWWRKEAVKSERSDDFTGFTMDMGLDIHLKDHPFTPPPYRTIPSLMAQVHNVPLTKGIGYRGWLHFKARQISQRDIDSKRMLIDVWLVDALQRRHRLNYKKNSDKDWDNSFYIFKE